MLADWRSWFARVGTRRACQERAEPSYEAVVERPACTPGAWNLDTIAYDGRILKCGEQEVRTALYKADSLLCAPRNGATADGQTRPQTRPGRGRKLSAVIMHAVA
jgi:hypothetical protein